MDIITELDAQRQALDELYNTKIKDLNSLDYEGFNALRYEYDLASFKIEIARKQLEIDQLEKMVQPTEVE